MYQVTHLTEQEAKWCDCVLEVAAKQPGQCNLQKAWFQERDHRECYNIYAVCAHEIGTTSRRCDTYYNYDTLPDDQLIAYANLNQIPVKESVSRQHLISMIKAKLGI